MKNSRHLLPQHQELIDASAISPEVAEARAYRSVTKKAELESLGFGKAQRRVPALLIPIHDVHGEIVQYQIRPDHPRINKRGKPVKYECPGGSHMVLDVPPMCREQLRDPTMPLFVTEGIRKADSAASQGLCCVGLPGVWNWRGSNADGGKVALPDWESIALNDRKVYIAFDSDVMEKPEVHLAMSRLKGFLKSRGAKVQLIYLPSGEGGKKVGLDDYLAAGHNKDDLLALASPNLRQCGSHQPGIASHVYRRSDQGLAMVKHTAQGDVPVRLTNFSAEIVEEIVLDDGAEEAREFRIDVLLRDGERRIIAVPVTRFNSMNWATEQLGSRALVAAGFGNRDHARAAIQELSTNAAQRRVYRHTGWREIDGRYVYLHAGGAIGPDGTVEGIEVDLPKPLQKFVLPDPPEGEERAEAVRASLAVLHLGPLEVTVPILAAVCTAPVRTADLSVFLVGPTGVGKSELAALAQQHSGPELDSRHLPASWSSTPNSLEGLAFYAKDALLVVDDFAPQGSARERAGLQGKAERILRAQGNNSGRGRMQANGSLRPTKEPRGLILSTGEDIPSGQSLRSRTVVVEIESRIDLDKLTNCQESARSGDLASAMAAYVQRISKDYKGLQHFFDAQWRDERSAIVRECSHARMADAAAKLLTGLWFFLRFAVEVEAISQEQSDKIFNEAREAMLSIVRRQEEHQAACDPVEQFVGCVRSGIASGQAHVADPKGHCPPNPTAWGWLEREVGFACHGNVVHDPKGTLVGWVDGEDLYLEPGAAYAVANKQAQQTGSALGVTETTLWKRLAQRGLIVSTDKARGTNKVRRVLSGARRAVIHLRADTVVVVSEQADQPAHSDQEGQPAPLDEPVVGRVGGQVCISGGAEPDHETRPEAQATGSPEGPVGELVGLGRFLPQDAVDEETAA